MWKLALLCALPITLNAMCWCDLPNYLVKVKSHILLLSTSNRMSRILILLMICCFMGHFKVLAQTKNFIDQSYVEVNGYAEFAGVERGVRIRGAD